jgi:hypothetical protein
VHSTWKAACGGLRHSKSTTLKVWRGYITYIYKYGKASGNRRLSLLYQALCIGNCADRPESKPQFTEALQMEYQGFYAVNPVALVNS